MLALILGPLSRGWHGFSRVFHTKWLGRCTKAFLKLRSIVVLQFIPGNQISQLDPEVLS
jgi:hypothetical protein